jgi:type VI secretion system secreted protein Hcp
MSFRIKFSLAGRSLNSMGSQLVSMAYGTMAITPRNLSGALSQVKSQYDAGIGSLVGRRQHSPLTIVREVDSSSPLLWQALCTNEALQSVDISVVRRPPSGGGEVVVSKISLTNATISKVNQFMPPAKPHGHRPSGNLTTNELERFDFTFQKITYTNVLGTTSASDDWTSTK